MWCFQPSPQTQKRARLSDRTNVVNGRLLPALPQCCRTGRSVGGRPVRRHFPVRPRVRSRGAVEKNTLSRNKNLWEDRARGAAPSAGQRAEQPLCDDGRKEQCGKDPGNRPGFARRLDKTKGVVPRRVVVALQDFRAAFADQPTDFHGREAKLSAITHNAPPTGGRQAALTDLLLDHAPEDIVHGDGWLKAAIRGFVRGALPGRLDRPVFHCSSPLPVDPRPGVGGFLRGGGKVENTKSGMGMGDGEVLSERARRARRRPIGRAFQVARALTPGAHRRRPGLGRRRHVLWRRRLEKWGSTQASNGAVMHSARVLVLPDSG